MAPAVRVSFRISWDRDRQPLVREGPCMGEQRSHLPRAAGGRVDCCRGWVPVADGDHPSWACARRLLHRLCTAHIMPKVLGAGIDNVAGFGVCDRLRRCARSATVAAPWSRAARAAGGQASVTSHGVVVPPASVVKE
eukprot:2823840-Pleurochrysis_carterae.AAC.3